MQPKSAEDVSVIVKTLTTVESSKPCLFAIRSGGHTPIPGFNNIDGGVTIDLLHMNSTSYSTSTRIASIQPAARWGSVYQTLEPLGRMVPGGRGSTVGVGGFLLGGGISHYASRVGFSCDNVVNFQLVLASGQIIDANQTSHADLFTALKGGSSNFGIVTRYDMQTFDNELLWGGIVTYPASTAAQHFQSLVNYGKNRDRDPNAALIVFQGYSTASPTDVVRIAFDYTQPVARPEVYKEFLAVGGNISDTTKIQPMSAVAAEFGSDTTKRYLLKSKSLPPFCLSRLTLNPSVQFRTLSFTPSLPTLLETARLYSTLLATLRAHASGQWRISCLHQLISPRYTANSTARGGNVLGLNRYPDDFIMYQSYLSWSEEKDDALFTQAGKELTDGIEKFAKEQGTEVEWRYLNYADSDQKPLEGYGEDMVRVMGEVAEKYDPDGVWQTKVPGGFKISQVG